MRWIRSVLLVFVCISCIADSIPHLIDVDMNCTCKLRSGIVKQMLYATSASPKNVSGNSRKSVCQCKDCAQQREESVPEYSPRCLSFTHTQQIILLNLVQYIKCSDTLMHLIRGRVLYLITSMRLH